MVWTAGAAGGNPILDDPRRRPTHLDEPTGLIEVADPCQGRVSRGDVAAVVAAVLADDSTVRRTIRFGNGHTPIAQAITT